MKKERNLLWLDLEMTGVNADRDVILEIASTITDSQLSLIAQGPALVIHQPATALALMSREVHAIHTKSGLLELVQESRTSVEEAEQATVDFLARHARHGHDELVLCGNSIWQDRSFLIRYMPRIITYLHYRLIDISAIKEVVRRWYPNNAHAYFKKSDNHRASEDVQASIAELKHYRKYFFLGGHP
jgi:oligoribonuclease